ncbi:MAG: L,D-transpeptidase [Ferruginibacter sp.]|nr:L,D-transpeptidase [Ferruginibacter sp.]
MIQLLRYSKLNTLFSICFFVCVYSSCKNKKKETAFDNFQYEQFKDSLLISDTSKLPDTINLFDADEFTPSEDSVGELLVQIDTIWRRELVFMDRIDSLKKRLNKTPGFSPEEKLAIKENIRIVDSFLLTKDTADENGCKEKDCILYAEINKQNQTLYLYMLGTLRDSFLISTGIGKYETPNLNLRPSGPVLTKYSSKKFPGGNYSGLGNMPYAIFLKGGYALHGTTPGNFSKLGSKASHGCIRMHPDNAKVFNALVKTVGLNQTWVSIKDSIQ